MSQSSRQQVLYMVGRETVLRCFESSDETDHTDYDRLSPNCHHIPAMKRHFGGHKFRDDRQVKSYDQTPENAADGLFGRVVRKL